MNGSGHVRPTAGHFARLSYDWGIGITANKDSYRVYSPGGYATIPANENGYLHGSVAISRPDIGPTSGYGRVFNHDFQESVAQLQEREILRRGEHYFTRHEARTRSSYLVYGEITNGAHFTPSIVGVEVHEYGAVSVYFKEYTKGATLDELAGWWVLGAFWMGLQVHILLGTSGPAHAAVLFDDEGVSDLSGKGRVWVTSSLHGPFPLLPVKGKEEDESGWYNWPKRSAESAIASIWDRLGRERFVEGASKDVRGENGLPPLEARKRLMRGRLIE